MTLRAARQRRVAALGTAVEGRQVPLRSPPRHPAHAAQRQAGRGSPQRRDSRSGGIATSRGSVRSDGAAPWGGSPTQTPSVDRATSQSTPAQQGTRSGGLGCSGDTSHGRHGGHSHEGVEPGTDSPIRSPSDRGGANQSPPARLRGYSTDEGDGGVKARGSCNPSGPARRWRRGTPSPGPMSSHCGDNPTSDTSASHRHGTGDRDSTGGSQGTGGGASHHGGGPSGKGARRHWVPKELYVKRSQARTCPYCDEPARSGGLFPHRFRKCPLRMAGMPPVPDRSPWN